MKAESVLECARYGDGYAIWRVFLPKCGWATTTFLKATGKTEEEAWRNFNERIGMDVTGVFTGDREKEMEAWKRYCPDELLRARYGPDRRE